MTEEKYYKPCSTCHNDECVWIGTKDTYRICEDYKSLDRNCISRQAVLAIVGDSCLDLNSYEDTREFCDEINALPSVNPQPKTGHWNIVSDGYGDKAYICECSECKDTVWVYKDIDRKWNYCPNCGAKMEVPNDESGKV